MWTSSHRTHVYSPGGGLPLCFLLSGWGLGAGCKGDRSPSSDSCRESGRNMGKREESSADTCPESGCGAGPHVSGLPVDGASRDRKDNNPRSCGFCPKGYLCSLPSCGANWYRSQEDVIRYWCQRFNNPSSLWGKGLSEG